MTLELGVSSQDIYVRLSRGGVRTFEQMESGGIVFVDYRRDADLMSLRDASLGRRGDPKLIVVRDSSRDENALDRAPTLVTSEMQLSAPVAVLKQEAGKPFLLEGLANLEPGIMEEIATRSRAVELRALLDWGRAIWRPSGYHYQLPSGLHCDAFVKLADAIRRRSDPGGSRRRGSSGSAGVRRARRACAGDGGRARHRP